MGKLTPHTFKKKLKYKDAVETGYFAHEGVGSVAQAMLEVRVLTSEPPSRVRLLLLIKYKEGVVNKSYFDQGTVAGLYATGGMNDLLFFALLF